MARQKYKKKPEFFYAIQYSGTNQAEMVDFCPECIWNEAKGQLLFYKGSAVVEPTSWVLHDNAMRWSMMTDPQFTAYFSLDTGPPA